MKIKTRAGAKVFFFGEYAALKKGSAALFSLQPEYQFELSFSPLSKTRGHKNMNNHNESQLEGLHVDSAAAKYILAKIKNEELPPGHYALEKAPESLSIPGFGSSTVEYLTVLAGARELTQKQTMNLKNDSGLLPNFFKSENKNSTDRSKTKTLPWNEEILSEYQFFSRPGGALDSNSLLPSGYDLLAQNSGGATVINSAQIDSESSASLMKLTSQYTIGFFKTGRKLPTHTALHGLEEKSLESIYQAAEDCRAHLNQGEDFWRKFDFFVEMLLRLGWTDLHSQQTLEKLRKLSNVFKAKACGAMGVDTIMVVLKKGLHDLELFNELQIDGLKLIATNQKLAAPFTFERIL